MNERGSGGARDRRRTLMRVLDAAERLQSELNDAAERAREIADEEPGGEDTGLIL